MRTFLWLKNTCNLTSSKYGPNMIKKTLDSSTSENMLWPKASLLTAMLCLRYVYGTRVSPAQKYWLKKRRLGVFLHVIHICARAFMHFEHAFVWFDLVLIKFILILSKSDLIKKSAVWMNFQIFPQNFFFEIFFLNFEIMEMRSKIHKSKILVYLNWDFYRGVTLDRKCCTPYIFIKIIFMKDQ